MHLMIRIMPNIKMHRPANKKIKWYLWRKAAIPTPVIAARKPLTQSVPQIGVTHNTPKTPRTEVMKPPTVLSQASFLFILFF